MSRNEKHKDQAEELRKRMQQGEADEVKQVKHAEEDVMDELFDISNLPPRSEVHKRKKKEPEHKKQSNQKLKYPLIRLLVFFFILLPFVVLSIYTYAMNHLRTGNDRDDYERLNVEQNTDEGEKERVFIPEETEE